MTDILLILGGYLFGSISAAIVVCKLMGLPDPRTEGSRNPGTTNVLRLGGKKAAILTLAGDMLKGLLPVLIARALHAGPEVQRHFSATSTRCFSVSRAARGWRQRWASSSACTGRPGWR
jgi:acyl-phosphate glycerol 3-phosphate acyltransferase